MVTSAPNIWTAELSSGYFNKYYFRGVNVLKSVSAENESAGIVSSRLNLAYSRKNDAFLAGFGYVQALRPQLTSLDSKPQVVDGTIKDDEIYDVASRSRYAESNLYLAYSRSLIPDHLTATTGYNRYNFSNAGYWEDQDGPQGYDSSNEVFLRLDFPGVPYVNPSLTYVREFEGFEGSYLEAKIEADFDLFAIGSTRVRFQPYIGLSYDFQYNGDNDGWNAVEYGARIPFLVTESVTVSLSGNYTQGLDFQQSGDSRVNPGFWGGIVVSGTWGSNSLGGGGSATVDDVGKAVTIPVQSNPWELSVGSGWRNIDSTFEQGRVAAYRDIANSYNVQQDRGSPNVATLAQGAVYANGSVGGNLGSGTAGFTRGNGSQEFGSDATNDRQVLFSSQQFSYRETGRNVGVAPVTDDDGVMSPYFEVDRELWRNGKVSVRGGLSYSYTNSDMDSGYRLGRLDFGFENRTDLGFVYDVFGGTGGVIVDPAAFFLANPADSRAGNDLNPQRLNLVQESEVSRVAGFVSSSLDVSSNDLALPVDLRYDLGNRLHVALSVAPTVSFVNSSLKTDVEYRALTPQDFLPGQRSRVINENTNFLQRGVGGNSPNQLLGGVFTVADVTAPDPVGTEEAGSGKAGTPTPLVLPGTLLATDTFRASESAAIFGVSATAKVTLDLNDTGTWFIDVWGRYHYADQMSVSNGLTSSTVDIGGWQMGSGIGIRF